jgi:hypothetical protein
MNSIKLVTTVLRPELLSPKWVTDTALRLDLVVCICLGFLYVGTMLEGILAEIKKNKN